MGTEKDINKRMAELLVQRIKGEIAKCKSDISIADVENVPHHADIVYESHVRKDALETVLTDVVETIEREENYEDYQKQVVNG